MASKILNGKTLYSPKYNLEFYHITKNGMTSIIRGMQLNWHVKEDLPDDRKVFCVLRDPVTRTISAFQTIRQLNNAGNYQHTFRRLAKNVEDGIVRNKDIVEAFDLYLKELKCNGWWDSHNRPQIHFLEGLVPPGHNELNIRHLSDVDVFIDFSNLNMDIKKLTDGKVFLPKTNVGNSSIKDVLYWEMDKFRGDILNLYKVDQALYQTRVK